MINLVLSLVIAFALDPHLTPGALCSTTDRDFDHMAAGGFAVCHRSVSTSKKHRVLARYGVPWAVRAHYEVDHLVPLCAGGSNAVQNLWPEPVEDAARKDRLENAVCARLRRGTTTQREAVRAFTGGAP